MISSYADDVTIAVSYLDFTRDASTISQLLADSFTPIVEWAKENKLDITPDKSSVTLFTPWTSQVNTSPAISIHNTPVPSKKKAKIL